MNLIYIGEEFYERSKSKMSSIYTEEGTRSDWGYVELFLRNGGTVYIRPATKIEKNFYLQKLEALK